MNHLQNVIDLNQFAVSDVKGSVLFHSAKDHNFFSIREKDFNNDETIEVEVIHLDAVIGEKEIDGLEIDTEGHELNVINGAIRLITKYKPFIMVEFNTTILKSKV